MEDNSFTLRDRDSTKQVRASLDEILEAVVRMCKGKTRWDEVRRVLPAFESKEEQEG